VLLATTQTLHDEPGDAMRQAFKHLTSDWIEFGLKAWTMHATVPSSSPSSSHAAAAADLVRWRVRSNAAASSVPYGLQRQLFFCPTVSEQQWRRPRQVETLHAVQGSRRFRRERVVMEE